MNRTSLGIQKHYLEGFMKLDYINTNTVKIAVIGAGQGGSKIATEFIRLGYYGILYNTCKQDNDNIREILSAMDDVDYKILDLEGYDGASKIRERGLKAIQDNRALLQKELLSDTKIIEADFVWIIAALGGGTGNGSLAITAQIVSGMMRKQNRFEGKPTVGIIAALPERHSKHQIKLNAAQALKEIQVLQKNKLIGSVLLIDNEKLINDYLERGNEAQDWAMYGNITTARLIAELEALSSLPGSQNFDKAEFLDVFSSPGFVNIGKLHLKEPIEEEEYATLIKECFTKHNLFADGFDYSSTIHGGMIILAPSSSKVLNGKDAIKLHRAMEAYLTNPMTERTHFGYYHLNQFGSYNNPRFSDEAIIYAIAVTNKLPSPILSMTQEALKQEEEKQKQLKNNDFMLSDLLGSTAVENSKEEETIELSFDDILSGNLFKGDTNDKANNSDEKEAEIDDELANIFKQYDR